MSGAIDNKVVGLKWEDGSFKQGIGHALSALDKLKAGLRMDGATKGFEAIQKGAKGVNLTSISEGVDSLKERFSNLGIVAGSILGGLGVQALNAGKKFLTNMLGPIKEGFNEYELKMGSIQTIMAGSGESLATVNKYLNELNTYADKTIYSFKDMTSNIGKFTNAGVDLKTSVAAIQGISNAAALSGANADEASRAMYNFSQALAAGHVKLIDWKSIELANMATKEFKDQLIGTAVATGVLKKGQDGLIRTTKGTIVDSKKFNETLAEQWLTTEVLTKTLGKYSDETTDIGKRAFAAARDVKTFSQLMSTIQEGIGSGWAQTWEIVLGDFDEAKRLWGGMYTVIGNFIDVSSDARNKMLSDWKAEGGREAILSGFENIFKALVSIIGPIGKAFREIFPPTTGKQLFAISDFFRRITEAMILSEKTSDRLRRTFKGIFAIFSIVGQIIGAVVRAFFALTGAASGSGGGILMVTATLGDFLVWVDKTLRETDILNKIFETLGKVLRIVLAPILLLIRGAQALYPVLARLAQPMIDFVRNLDLSPYIASVTRFFDLATQKITAFINKVRGFDFGPIGDFFKNLWNDIAQIASSNFEGIWQRVQDRIQSIRDGLNDLKRIVGVIGRWFNETFPVISEFASKIGEMFKRLGQKIKDLFQGADMSTLADGANVALIAIIILQVKKVIDLISNFDVTNGLFTGLAGALDEVGNSLKVWQASIKAEVIMKIAVAIGILTLALVVLALIDPKKLSVALGAMAAMFAQLIAALKALEATMKVTSGTQLALLAVSIIAVAVALILLAVAVKMLSKLKPKELAAGLIAVVVLLAGLTASIRIMAASKSEMIMAAGALLALSVAVLILAVAVKMLSKIDPQSLTKGLVAITLLMIALSQTVDKMNMGPKAIANAIALILIAGALNKLVKVVQKFGEMDMGTLVKGVGALIVVLAALSLFAFATSKSTEASTLNTAAMAGAVLALAYAVEKLGALPLWNLVKGLGALGVALAMVTIALKSLPKDTAKDAAGFAIMAAALLIMAVAIEKLGSMSMGDLAKGLIGMTVALGVMAVVMMTMGSGPVLKGASAMIIMAIALNMLYPALKALGSLSLKELGTALLALVGVFAILAVVGVIGNVVGGGLMAMGLGLLLLGAGLALAGAAMLWFSIGLSTLAVSGVAGMAAFVAGMDMVMEKLPAWAAQLALALVSFVTALASAAPAFVGALGDLLIATLDEISGLIPQVVVILLELVKQLLVALADALPEILVAGYRIITTLLQGVRDNIGQITVLVAEIIVNFLNALATQMPSIVNAAANLLIQFVSGLTKEIPRVAAAVTVMILTFLDTITRNLGLIISKGGEIILKFLQGITGEVPKVIAKAGTMMIDFLKKITDMFTKIRRAGIDIILEFLEGIAQDAESVIQAGMNIILDFLDGIAKMVPDVVDAGFQMIIDLVNGVASAIEERAPELRAAGARLATAIIDGMSGGLISGAENVAAKAWDLGKKAINAISGAVKEGSPSKEAYRVGLMVALGFGNAIEDGTARAEKMSAAMGTKSLTSMQVALNKAATTVDLGIDKNPVIRPVVDLKKFHEDTKKMHSYLSSPVDVKLNQKPTSSIAKIAAETQSNLVTDKQSYRAIAQEIANETRKIASPLGTTIQYNQTNNSPKSLSRVDIYNQTRKQLYGVSSFLTEGPK